MSFRLASAAATRHQTGNMPVLLVASHGGDARPDDIPDNGQAAGRPDLLTDVLASEIDAQLRRLGKTPYLAVAGISRSKVDLNDPPGEAYVGAGKQMYDAFHNGIRGFLDTATAAFGWVLIVDLHGFSPRRTLPGEPSDLVLGTRQGKTMPLTGLGALNRAGLASYLTQQGWRVKPGGVEPEIVFSGGYIVRHHGNPAAGRYAVQLEIASAVRKNDGQRLRLAADLAHYFDVISKTG
jgi:N-formylglutamate amidohydrolase